MNKLRWSVAGLIFIFGACNGGGVDEGPGEIFDRSVGGTSTGNGLVMAAVSTASNDGAVETRDRGGLVFLLDSIRAHAEEVEITLPAGVSCADLDMVTALSATCEPEDDGDSGDELNLAGGFVFDMLTRTVEPSLDSLALPAIRVSEVEVAFAPADEDEGVVSPADPLSERTVRATGRFDYEGQSRDLVVELDFEGEVAFENENGVAIDAEQAIDLILQFDVADWLASLPIQECLDDGDLVLVGNTLTLTGGDGECGDVPGGIVTAITTSGDLEVDIDDD
ncbi:MAG: hypothetical protein AAF658_09640 [Myxococcota bacterium]